jgi:hypothetical protein
LGEIQGFRRFRLLNPWLFVDVPSGDLIKQALAPVPVCSATPDFQLTSLQSYFRCHTRHAGLGCFSWPPLQRFPEENARIIQKISDFSRDGVLDSELPNPHPLISSFSLFRRGDSRFQIQDFS